MENCTASRLSVSCTSWDWSLPADEQKMFQCRDIARASHDNITPLTLLCNNFQANIQGVPKYVWIMNATFEVTHKVFNENEKSNHIQSQTHITNFRLSSASNDRCYIFSPNFSSGVQPSISNGLVDVFSFIHISTEWLNPIYLPPKYQLVSSTFLCLYHWLPNPRYYFSSP